MKPSEMEAAAGEPENRGERNNEVRVVVEDEEERHIRERSRDRIAVAAMEENHSIQTNTEEPSMVSVDWLLITCVISPPYPFPSHLTGLCDVESDCLFSDQRSPGAAVPSGRRSPEFAPAPSGSGVGRESCTRTELRAKPTQFLQPVQPCEKFAQ